MNQGTEVKTPDLKRKYRALIGVLFSFISVVRDIYLIRGFSIGIYNDSLTYLKVGLGLLNIIPPTENKVSLPYPLLTAITRVDIDPLRLIWVQILLAAFATGFMVYILSRRSLFLALLTGFMLSTDLLWGSFNRSILTEGPIMSFLVLSLGVIFIHYDKKEVLRPWELLLGGILFAWTFSIRPGYIYFLPIIVLGYLWVTRSWKKTAWLSVGIGLLFGLSSLLNLARFGDFKIYGSSGTYLDPISGNDIFSPDNGPYSKKISELALSCNIKLLNPGSRIYRDKLKTCAVEKGVKELDLSQWYGKVYKELILSHPVDFADLILQRSAKMLSYDLVWYSWYNLNEESKPCPEASPLCKLKPKRQSGSDDPVVGKYLGLAIGSSQFYALPTRAFLNTPRDEVRKSAMEVSIIFWVVLAGFAFFANRGIDRFTIAACLLFTAYAILTVSASLGPKYRYAAPLSPLYSILAAEIVFIISGWWWRLTVWSLRFVFLLGVGGLVGLIGSYYNFGGGLILWLSAATFITAAIYLSYFLFIHQHDKKI